MKNPRRMGITDVVHFVATTGTHVRGSSDRWPSWCHMPRLFKYLLVSAALLSLVASLLLEYVPRLPDGSFCFGCVFLVVVITLSALIDQKWTVLAALSVWIIVSFFGG